MSVEGAQEFTVEVAASASECFETIVDFASYPRWSSAVRAITVLDSDASGLARRVEFRIDITLKSIRYVLEYEYKKPSQLTWRCIEGDIQAIEGSYRFRDLDCGRAQVTCRQAVSLGFWLPAPLRRFAERSALRDSVLEFKREVEQRSTQAARRGSRRKQGAKTAKRQG